MIAVIAAYSKNRVIGNNGMIPWKIKGEQKRFKELTYKNIVVMGRRTYEEIGKPLEGRKTIVISKTKKYKADNLITVSSLEEALQKAEGKDVFISGGSNLYKMALNFVDKLYITEIEKDFEGDTFFPQFDESEFEKKIEEHVDGEIPYSYVTFTRKVLMFRPHHGMCLCFFEGKGYSKEYIKNMYSIIEKLNENPYIRLSRECDMICRMCPDNIEGVCTSDKKVNDFDTKVLENTKFSFGQKIKYQDFHNAVIKNIISCGKLKSICELCQWYYICSNKSTDRI